jgi:hypothetical protein
VIDSDRVLDAFAGSDCCSVERETRVVSDGCAVCRGHLGWNIRLRHRRSLGRCTACCRMLSPGVIVEFVQSMCVWAERYAALASPAGLGRSVRMSKDSFRRVLSKVWRMRGILAPRRQHLSCYGRSAERLASWEVVQRCIVVAGIAEECHFAALQQKTWRSRVSRGEWRNLHFLALVVVSTAKPARGGRELCLYNVMR